MDMDGGGEAPGGPGGEPGDNRPPAEFDGAQPAPPPPFIHPPAVSESLGTSDTTGASDSAMATSSDDDDYEGDDGESDDDETDGDSFMSEDEAAAAAQAAAEAAEMGGGDGRARAADLAAAMLVAAAAAAAAAPGDGELGDGLLLDGGQDEMAPGAVTDDSGDEAAAIGAGRRPAPLRPAPGPDPLSGRTAPGDGAGEGGRGAYVAGPATLHPSLAAASSHFQAADALAAGPAADLGGCLKPSPGEEDVVLVDRFTVSVWRLPRSTPPPPKPGPGGATPTTTAAPRPPPPPPRLLARALYTQVEPYTVARSPDGRYLALGGDLGVVAMLRLERCPGLPGCGLCGRAAAAAARAAAAAAPAARAGPPAAGAAAAAPPPPPPPPAESDAAAITPTPAHLRPTAVCALGGALAAVANNNMVNGLRFGHVAGRLMLVAAVQDRYVYFLDPCGAVPGVLGANGGVPGNPDALAVTSLRADDDDDGGGGGGAPPPPPPPNTLAAGPAHRTRALDAYAATPDGGGITPAGGTRTAVSGPFPRPVNLALPSPDGRSIAVVGDFPAAYVLRGGGPAPYTAKEAACGPAAAAAAQGGGSGRAVAPPAANPRLAPPGSGALRLAFGVDAPPRLRSRVGAGGAGGGAHAVAAHPAVTLDVGAQYAAWSPDSSLLAATSDALRAAFVWHVPRGQPLLRIEAAGRPVLAATFLPGAPATLVFAEAARRAYAADLRHVPGGLTKLPPVRRGGDGPDGLIPLPRVAGLAATPGGRLLAATRAGLAEWAVLAPAWDPAAERHRGCGDGRARPPAWRAAAAAFLCIASLPAARRPAGCGPWSLPGDLVDDILAAASTPVGAWVGVGAPPRKAPPALPRLLAPPGGATYAAVAAMRAVPVPAAASAVVGEQP